VGPLPAASDRANLYGPYYASNWGVYQDGVQDGYPFETEGRDDGIMYWGQYDKVKFSVGAFDVSGLTTGDSDVLLATRAQVDFWDSEDGYYLNGTYYGTRICSPSACARRPRTRSTRTRSTSCSRRSSATQA
jgi:hypothetical protein